ncbi:MAG TPA: DUF4198 domain-containing protein [Rhizobacter sp.]
MKHLNSLKTLALAATLVFGGAAHAHRGWMLPSATVLSGHEPWVTVDAAISNDVFYFEHNAMRLDNLVVHAPDGSTVKPENQGTGRYRSTFDVRLAQKGTYKMAVVADAMFASFKVGGETRRVRGSAESLAKDIPANATELNVSHNISRNEIFVTSGKPSGGVLKPTGRGLELVPVTHPNDLVVGETAKFRFLLDGQPAAGITVTVIPGGIRYRDKLEEQKLTADAQGEVSIQWAGPGMYWLNAAPARAGGDGEGMGGAEAPRGAAGTLAKPTRRATYATTLEVLPQ